MTDRRELKSPVPLTRLIAAGVAVSALLGLGLLCVFARLADGHGSWWITGHHLSSGQWYDVVRSTIGAVGVFGIGAAGLLAYRRQRTSEDTYALERDRNNDSQVINLRARFATATEQLGHESPAVRLAGVYAMADLVDDWRAAGDGDQMQVCIDVLCAYLRIPYDPESPKAVEGERQVRWTVISVIRDHLQNPNADNSWCGRNLNFSAATLDGGDFDGARFSGGTVSFDGAEFSGGIVGFERAEFSGGTVSFDGARFSGGTVSFRGARFSGGGVEFREAELSGGSVGFREAEFSGGLVNFGGARFFDAAVDFCVTKFCGGIVSFGGATFSGGLVFFGGAAFSDGLVNFSMARFSGATVSFERAELSGGIVRFAPTSGTWISPPVVDWAVGDEPPEGVEPRIWPAATPQ